MNIISFFRYSFSYKTTVYEVYLPKQQFVHRLEAMFDNRSLFEGPNLTGKFVDFPNTFTITPKWSFVMFKGFERDSAYLKGVLTEQPGGRTRVEIAVRPNAGFVIMFVLFLLFGINRVYEGIQPEAKNDTFVACLLIFLFALPFLIVMARIASGRLRNSFEQYFGLTEQEDEALTETEDAL